MDEKVVLPQELLSKLVEALFHEGRVKIDGLGVFEVRNRAPRRARNPRTGDRINVPRKLYVSFKAGAALERRLAEELVRLQEREGLPEEETDPGDAWWRLWGS